MNGIMATPGATGVSVIVQVVDDQGLGVTGLVASTFPAVRWSVAGQASSALSPSDLASASAAWSAGGVAELAGGYYRLDLPDAVFASAGRAQVWAEASGKHLLCPPITVLAPTVGGYASGQDPATLVLDAAAADHDTAATVGGKLNEL